MDDGIGQDIAQELDGIHKAIGKQIEVQQETNELLSALIHTLQANSQELEDLRKHLIDQNKTVG